MKVLIIILLGLMVSSAWAEDAQRRRSIVDLSAQADTDCIHIETLGVCPQPKREPPIGVKIRYFSPEVFVETVKNPGDYVMQEYGVTVGAVAKVIAQTELEIASNLRPLSVTSGSSAQSLASSNLQFNDVHIYDFPLAALFEDTLCSETPNATLGIRYLSEMDSIAWRRGDIEKFLPQSIASGVLGPQCHRLPVGAAGQCMESWGPLYPRTGFVMTPSAAVASVTGALRAMSIATDIIPGHVVESKLNFQVNLPIDKVQMIHPVKSSCFPIGKNPRLWENDKTSKEGKYVWIYWHRRECCI